MPANKRWLSLDRRLLLSSPAQMLCREQFVGFKVIILVPFALVKLQDYAQTVRLQYSVFLAVQLENNSITSLDRESVIFGNDTKVCTCF